MKRCTLCKQERNFLAFGKKMAGRNGLNSVCKACNSKRQCEYQKRNKSSVNVKNRQWAARNRDKTRAASLAWVNANRDKVYADNKAWRAANGKKMLAYTRKYQAAKLRATPSWLTAEQVSEMIKIYENCPVGFHVDHIIPLQGKKVKGLHVPWNLQYLPALENMRKGNKVSCLPSS